MSSNTAAGLMVRRWMLYLVILATLHVRNAAAFNPEGRVKNAKVIPVKITNYPYSNWGFNWFRFTSPETVRRVWLHRHRCGIGRSRRRQSIVGDFQLVGPAPRSWIRWDHHVRHPRSLQVSAKDQYWLAVPNRAATGRKLPRHERRKVTTKRTTPPSILHRRSNSGFIPPPPPPLIAKTCKKCPESSTAFKDPWESFHPIRINKTTARSYKSNSDHICIDNIASWALRHSLRWYPLKLFRYPHSVFLVGLITTSTADRIMSIRIAHGP